MKVLLLGGSGFIGSAVLQKLLDQADTEVAALSHRQPIDIAHDQLTIHRGGLDNIDRTFLNEVNPDVVIHLARPTFPRFRFLGRKFAAIKGRKLNADLVESVLSMKHTRLIYVSGSLMYGNSTAPMDESHPLNPISFARDYAPLEVPILEAANSSDRVLLLRVPWVLGDGSWFRWIYADFYQRNRAIPLFGDGTNKMHFIGQRDLAQWIVQHASSALSGVQNLYSKTALTQSDFAKKLAGLLGCSIRPVQTGYEGVIYEAFQSNIELTTQHPFHLEESDFDQSIEALCRGLSEYE